MTDRPVFFVHVMKTAGATFRLQMVANLGAAGVYPDAALDGDIEEANWSIDRLRALDAERWASVRAVAGHFPFVVRELIEPAPVTLALLRHPVDRTVSYLRQSRRLQPQHAGMDLEEIYEDPFVFRCFVENHQAKLFAMGPEDRLESYMDVVPVDDARLRRARAALAEVDVLGLTEDHHDFVARACTRLGWTRHDVPDRHVQAARVRISRSFRRRIERDNRADLEFYESARALVAEQRGRA